MASSIAGGPINGPSLAVKLAPAAAGCVSRVADGPPGVPEGWPKFLDEPMAWVGPQFTDESEYIHTLSESDLQEAENALLVFKGTSLFLRRRFHGVHHVANTSQPWGLTGIVSPETTSLFPLWDQDWIVSAETCTKARALVSFVASILKSTQSRT
jgi:hypothetical protein